MARLSDRSTTAVQGVLRRQAEFDSAETVFERYRAAPAFAEWTETSLRAYIRHGFAPQDRWQGAAALHTGYRIAPFRAVRSSIAMEHSLQRRRARSIRHEEWLVRRYGIARAIGLGPTSRAEPDRPDQPYVELWAGVSDQFFHAARFPALGEISIAETFSPTVGMSNVTHANQNMLVNLSH